MAHLLKLLQRHLLQMGGGLTFLADTFADDSLSQWPMEAVDAADARQRLEHGDFDKKFFILPPHECFRLRKYEGQIFNPIVRRGPVIRGTVPMGNVRALEAFLGFGNQ